MTRQYPNEENRNSHTTNTHSTIQMKFIRPLSRRFARLPKLRFKAKPKANPDLYIAGPNEQVSTTCVLFGVRSPGDQLQVVALRRIFPRHWNNASQTTNQRV